MFEEQLTFWLFLIIYSLLSILKTLNQFRVKQESNKSIIKEGPSTESVVFNCDASSDNCSSTKNFFELKSKSSDSLGDGNNQIDPKNDNDVNNNSEKLHKSVFYISPFYYDKIAQEEKNTELNYVATPTVTKNKMHKSLIKTMINYSVSFNSSFLIVGSLSESYLFGIRMVGNIFAVLIGHFYSAILVQPFLYSLDKSIKTPYHYFAKRYRDKDYVRAVTASVAMFFYLSFLSLYLWGCTVLLSILLPIKPLWILSIILGMYSTMGSVVGGFSQSVKVNAFQFLILIGSLISAIKLTLLKNNHATIGQLWQLAEDNNRTNFFNTNVDLTTRYTIMNQLV
jgi:hypothetical protein